MREYDWKERVAAAETGERRVRRVLGDHIGVVTLAVLLLLQILVPLVSAGVRNPFTPAYLFSTLSSLFSTLLAYYLFVPNGRQEGLERPASAATLAEWKKESDRVRNAGSMTRFRAYCREWAEREAKARWEAALSRLLDAGIDRETYESTWRVASKKARRRARRRGQLTKEQARCLAKLRPVPVRPLSPGLILTGGDGERGEAALYGNSPYLRRAMARKPVVCVASVLVQSFFYPDLRQNADPVVILCGVAVRVFFVCCAALSGYRTGLRAAACHLDDVRCRTVFLAEFNESADANTEAKT